MSAKSTSPEAAQKKLWTVEIKLLGKQQTEVLRDCNRTVRDAKRVVDTASKALNTANAKYKKILAKTEKFKAAQIKEIETRMAILRGRISG